MAKGIKTGGRVSGTPNKLTKEIRAILKDCIYLEIEKMADTLNELQPKERAEIVIKLMAYALPKVEPIKADRFEPTDWEL